VAQGARRADQGLDASIAEIRKQLDEAKALRADAEALKADYASRIANAEKDVAAMMEHARTEADAIIAKAESDTTAVIARREKMASDKIEAAERGAVAELRNKAAQAAAVAATGLIAATMAPMRTRCRSTRLSPGSEPAFFARLFRKALARSAGFFDSGVCRKRISARAIALALP
jgi:F0F1-type ATP synthase membrane subunit b/b'